VKGSILCRNAQIQIGFQKPHDIMSKGLKLFIMNLIAKYIVNTILVSV